MSHLARCEGCSKTYRVPHARKEWTCKVCDGVLVPGPEQPEAPEAPESAERACHACGAIHAGGEAFCEVCGAPLAGDAAPRRKRSSVPRTGEERAAAEEMRRASKRLSRLKVLLEINRIFAVIGLLAAGGMALQSEVAASTAILVLVLGALNATLAFLAVRFVDTHPFPLVATLAGLQTLEALWAYFDGEVWMPNAVWALLLWMLSLDAAHYQRLARQFPDLYLARRLRGEHLKGLSGEDSIRVRHRQRQARAQRRSLLVFGGTGIAAVLALVTYRLVTAPPTPEAAAQRFRAAWNAGDADAMADEVREDQRARLGKSLSELPERYDWGGRYPQVDAVEWSLVSQSVAAVDLLGEAGVLPMRMNLVEGGRWVVAAMDFRQVRDWQPGR